ncbi:MAG: right-handed parallel beta-helix repeat-containing protein [Pseudomonadota bacterium]
MEDCSDVAIQGITVESPVSIGILVKGGDGVRLVQNHVRGTTMIEEDVGSGRTQDRFGYGLALTGVRNVVVTRNHVQGSESVGIYLRQSTGEIKQNYVLENVEGIRLSNCGMGAAADASQFEVSLSGNHIEGNYRAGIKILSSMVMMKGNTVLGTLPEPDDQFGEADGISVVRQSELGVSSPASRILLGGTAGEDSNVVKGCGRAGVLLGDQTVADAILGNLIQGNEEPGVWLQGASQALAMEGNQILDNGLAGIGLTGASFASIGSEGETTSNRIAGTRIILKTINDSQQHEIGDGIGVFQGSSADIRNNEVVDNQRAGVILDHANGPKTFILGNVIDVGGEGIHDLVLQGDGSAPVPTGQIGGNTNLCDPPECSAIEALQPEPGQELVVFYEALGGGGDPH